MSLTLSRPLIFLDLETTGTDVAKDRIVEISIIKLYPDCSEEINTFRVNPGILIPAEATAVHGITNDDVKDKPTFLQLSPTLLVILSNSDICGYNLVKFDFPLLRMEFARNHLDFSIIGINLIDPMLIFMKKEPRDLTASLKFYCNENLADAHSAAADTIAAKKILLAQIEKYDDVPSTVQELSAYSLEGTRRYADITGKLIYNANNEIVYSFGKNKNKKVIEDPSYAEWVLSADFPDDTKAIIRNLFTHS